MSIPDYIGTNFDTLLRAASNGHLALMECTDAINPDMSSAPSGVRARTTSSRRLATLSMAIPTTPICHQPKPCQDRRRPDPAAMNRVWTRRFACQRASRFRFAFGDA